MKYSNILWPGKELSVSKLNGDGGLGVALKGAKMEKTGGGVPAPAEWCTGAGRLSTRPGLALKGAAVHKDCKLKRYISPFSQAELAVLSNDFVSFLKSLILLGQGLGQKMQP